MLLAALTSVAITVGIVGVLVYESMGFFQQVSLLEFLTDRQWTPLFSEPHYGILPLVSGTVVTTAVALAVAVPMGSLIAIYLSEYASRGIREVIKPALELLSAVPTVVYGYFALLFVTPALQKLWPELPGFNMLSAGSRHRHHDRSLRQLRQRGCHASRPAASSRRGVCVGSDPHANRASCRVSVGALRHYGRVCAGNLTSNRRNDGRRDRRRHAAHVDMESS